MKDSFNARSTLTVGDRQYQIYRLDAINNPKVAQLPFSLKILLENLLRTEDGLNITRDDIQALVNWDPKAEPDKEIAFTPRAWSCRTSPACLRWWIWRRCAMP